MTSKLIKLCTLNWTLKLLSNVFRGKQILLKLLKEMEMEWKYFDQHIGSISIQDWWFQAFCNNQAITVAMLETASCLLQFCYCLSHLQYRLWLQIAERLLLSISSRTNFIKVWVDMQGNHNSGIISLNLIGMQDDVQWLDVDSGWFVMSIIFLRADALWFLVVLPFVYS